MATQVNIIPFNMFCMGAGHAYDVSISNGFSARVISWKQSFLMIAGQGIYLDGRYVKGTRGIVTKYTYRIESMRSGTFLNDMNGSETSRFKAYLKHIKQRRTLI